MEECFMLLPKEWIVPTVRHPPYPYTPSPHRGSQIYIPVSNYTQIKDAYDRKWEYASF